MEKPGQCKGIDSKHIPWQISREFNPIEEAERIAENEFQAKQMVVLSGTGAREYYRNESDYSSHGDYMVKSLIPLVV